MANASGHGTLARDGRRWGVGVVGRPGQAGPSQSEARRQHYACRHCAKSAHDLSLRRLPLVACNNYSILEPIPTWQFKHSANFMAGI